MPVEELEASDELRSSGKKLVEVFGISELLLNAGVADGWSGNDL